MEDKNTGNYAFIDGHNLHVNILKSGWKLDHDKFRRYLKEHLNVSKAFIFIGFVPENLRVYRIIEKAGFIIIFKDAVRKSDGSLKGNCDIDMTLRICMEIWNCDQIIVSTGDGDFLPLIRILISLNKLKTLLVPNKRTCSYLYTIHIPEYVTFISKYKDNIELDANMPHQR